MYKPAKVPKHKCFEEESLHIETAQSSFGDLDLKLGWVMDKLQVYKAASKEINCDAESNEMTYQPMISQRSPSPQNSFAQ